MQTFLTCRDFSLTARQLDRQRLGCQRKEAMQILDILNGKYSAWRKHPAVLMWQGYENALIEYRNCILYEWEIRGYKNILSKYIEPGHVIYPAWFSDERVFSSHRAALLHKNIEWYSQFNWTESPELNYFWPVLSSSS